MEFAYYFNPFISTLHEMRPNATDSSQFKHVQKTQNFPVSSQTGLAFPYLHPLAHVNMREHAKKMAKRSLVIPLTTLETL